MEDLVSNLIRALLPVLVPLVLFWLVRRFVPGPSAEKKEESAVPSGIQSSHFDMDKLSFEQAQEVEKWQRQVNDFSDRFAREQKSIEKRLSHYGSRAGLEKVTLWQDIHGPSRPDESSNK